jgi:hypothetical protein
MPRGNLHPAIKKLVPRHAATVVPNLQNAAGIIDAHRARRCIRVVGVLEQLDERDIRIRDEAFPEFLE